MNLLKQRKLAFACARVESIKVGKNLPRLLQNLETWEHEEEQAALQGHIGEVSSKKSLLKQFFAKSLLLTHGWHSESTTRFGTVFCVGRPEQFGETNSVQHKPFATQFGSDVF